MKQKEFLDKRFASLVKKKSMLRYSLVYWYSKLYNYWKQKKKINKTDEKMLSDCCEAIIGAIFIDRGFELCKNYILKIWKKNIDKSYITILDPKTKLQEFSLKKYKKLPLYRFIRFSLVPNIILFIKFRLSIIGSKNLWESGNSKQAS